MDSEKGEFQPVGDAGLVVDASQIVLHHLLLGVEFGCDFLVLAAFGNECDDLYFFRGQALQNARAHSIVRRHWRCAHALDDALAGGHTVQRVYQLHSGDRAKDDPLSPLRHRSVQFRAVLQDDDGLASNLFNPVDDLVQVRAYAGGKQNDVPAKGSDGVQKPLRVRALGDDLKIRFQREHARYTGAKNHLIVRENDSLCQRNLLS